MLRKPTIVEICIQAVIAAAALLWVYELYSVVQIGDASGSYPWASNGPGTEKWWQLSRELYVVHLVVVVQFLAAAFALPWLTSAPSSTFAGLAILVWIFLSGHYAVRLLIA